MLVMARKACWLLLQCDTSGLPDFLEKQCLSTDADVFFTTLRNDILRL